MQTLRELQELYPSMTSVPTAELEAEWAGGATVMQVPRGTQLFAPGANCGGFPLVLSGEARVFRMAPSGRQLEMYRLTPGEICLVSSASLFSGEVLTAFAEMQTEGALWMIRPELFEHWLQCAPAFRRFVLGQFAARMADLTALIDALAFHRLDQRLAQALLGQGPRLQSTHQQLADRLGTAREIVTRLLKRFEAAGWVGLSREKIDILQPAVLRQVAAGELSG
ncbi:MAG: Crp/Fnr family transcriptional regulator [Thiomonas sp.]|jgi:CRP/FNR family transcriptional regulator|uniref:Transcriptional regulator, Crp/Fnr family n=1 Tax=Thiomonas intermedia (strain K12) TaxID=75379 RepID=D5X063_THIK1|nr:MULTISPECIES: Crp/Fnr family transcriptional regulator [Thiomonas]MDE1978209.1 Crp/Fnr family transcriptional regulator [Betaproteobacteria bacterium]OZB73131.1 MAG: transcriptional regulator [Thiomonas sp. 14-64-326]MDE2175991.1 Crp/Fnr family transcriptional regulator [Betaproteobacteria bacterium]MDE2268959.1 Crp/Fnr family transcriptional regulator [Betaproteobacteria bacterium]HML82973.1 Crp/Fnr family transcriptional regulator [Thiomonas arsenitoxydans]